MVPLSSPMSFILCVSIKCMPSLRMHLVFGLFCAFSLVSAVPTSSYECGACMLMINEMEGIIKKVDPAKTIEVGSFRVNPTGGQKGLQKIAYARSESHLHEIFDGICEKSKDYKLVVNSLTGKAVFVHKDATYLKEEKTGIASKLHNACNDFADSNEDAIIQFLKKEVAEPAKEFCQMELGVCSAVDVSQLPPNEPPSEGEKKVEVEEETNDEL